MATRVLGHRLNLRSGYANPNGAFFQIRLGQNTGDQFRDSRVGVFGVQHQGEYFGTEAAEFFHEQMTQGA
jgi:hypothetical protein